MSAPRGQPDRPGLRVETQAIAALRRTVERTPALLIATDAQGRIEVVSDRFLRRFGFDRLALTGRDLRALLVEGSRAKLDAVYTMGNGSRGDIDDLPLQLQTAHGEVVDVLASISAERGPGGELQVVQAVLMDVSRQRRVEADRWRQRALVDSLFDALPVAVILADAQRRILRVNPAGQRMFGYSEGEMVGQSTRILHPSQHAFERRGAERRQRPGDNHFQPYDCIYVRRTGEEFPAEMTGGYIYDAGGRHVATIGVIRDRTPEVQAAEDREELRRRATQNQRLESMRLLAAGVAHEFNNLLSATLTNAAYASEAIQQGDPDAEEALDDIVIAARRAGSLCQQMLAFTGEQLVSFEDTDLRRLVADTATLFSRSLGENVDLETDLPADVPRVRADPPRLQEALTQVLRNAAESYGAARGEVFVRLSEVVITAGALTGASTEDALSPGRWLAIDVADRGQGIAAEVQERMFEPFFSTRFTGRGLGLASALGTVRAHGGAIRVESHIGHGTRVRILLPPVSHG